MNQYTEHQLEYGRPSAMSEGIKYLLIGGGIGATLALLFAPKAGSELRTNISEAARTSIDTTLEKAKTLQTQSSHAIRNVKDKAAEWYDFAASRLSSGTNIPGDTDPAGRSANLPQRITDDPFSPDSQIQKSRSTGRRPSNIV